MEYSLIAAQHFPPASVDSPHNGNTSVPTSASNPYASFSRPSEQEWESNASKFSSDAIWLWLAVFATIGNVVVVAVVCACAF